jgi:chaperone required for assembly of F1-ATPase
MTGWKSRRFWKDVDLAQVEGGWGILLDGRPLKTPAKAPLVMPSRAMAEAVAEEWRAQTDELRPETMPVTRAANSAIDKITPQFDEVADIVAAYGGTDLLCYRAEAPEGLCRRQAEGWDPLLDWAALRFDARLLVAQGILPIKQDPKCLSRLSAEVWRRSNFELAALHDLVALSGSFVLGLAVCEKHLPPAEAWALSRIDEHWQIELWGQDAEAAKAEERKREDFAQAARFYALARSNG